MIALLLTEQGFDLAQPLVRLGTRLRAPVFDMEGECRLEFREQRVGCRRLWKIGHRHRAASLTLRFQPAAEHVLRRREQHVRLRRTAVQAHVQKRR